MSPGNPIRRCYPDLSRWPRAGHGSARPSPRPARPRSASDPCCRATPSLIATTAWRRDHSVRHVIRGRILDGRVEIPIEPAAPLRPTSRGFLP